MIAIRKNAFLLLAAAGCLLAGCATPKFSGVEEYKQLTKKASTAVQNAIHSLERVSASSGRPAPKATAAFNSDVQRLQVDSVQIRARARAIRARGDAYFADWSDNIAKIKDPRVREAAARSRPELEACFSQIKLASQEAGAAFEPFLSGLQKLRVELEVKPDAIASGGDQELAHATLDHGRQVLVHLGRINSELQKITALLTSRKPAAKE